MTRIGRLAATGAVALSVALLGLSTPAHADDTTGSITGHISADGQPLAAFVELDNADCSNVDAVNTDADNAFTFTNVQPGQYKLMFLPRTC